MVVLERVSDLEAEAVRAISKAGEVLSVDEARSVIDKLFGEVRFDEPHSFQVAMVIAEFWQAITPGVGIKYVTIKVGFEHGGER